MSQVLTQVNVSKDIAVATGAANVVPNPRAEGRPAKHWDWATLIGGELLRAAFPLRMSLSDCRSAAATCRFELRGQYANGNDWGLGFLTHVKTYGHIPNGVGGPMQPCVQKHRDWIEMNAHKSADLLLQCFGLDHKDIYREFGAPADGERKVIDLYEVVERCAPHLVQ